MAREYDPEKHCGGKTRNGTPCTQTKGWDTDHQGIGRCSRHGGATPTHQKSAEVEIAKRAVERFGLASVGHEIENVDPRDVLAEELWRTLVTVRGLDVVVGELGRDVYGETFHVSGMLTGEAKPNVLWTMWQDERRHLKAVAAEAAKAGVEARRMELDEAHANIIASLIRAIFGDPTLGLSAEQVRQALSVAAAHLRNLGAGQLTAGA